MPRICSCIVRTRRSRRRPVTSRPDRAQASQCLHQQDYSENEESSCRSRSNLLQLSSRTFKTKWLSNIHQFVRRSGNTNTTSSNPSPHTELVGSVNSRLCHHHHHIVLSFFESQNKVSQREYSEQDSESFATRRDLSVPVLQTFEVC